MSKSTHNTPLPQTDARSAASTPRTQIDAFLAQADTLSPMRTPGKRGRMIFALDATMSRQPTWDFACQLQAEMFHEAAAIGGLDVQLVYYRGVSECKASPWVSQPDRLAHLMEKIDCRGGHTQLGRVLSYARQETRRQPVQALVFVGDAMEEAVDDLCAAAGELGLLGVPAFMFQEGQDDIAEQAFREIARLTRGAYCRFSPGVAHELAELLRAAAAFAAGGRKALAALGHGGARQLLSQMN